MLFRFVLRCAPPENRPDRAGELLCLFTCPSLYGAKRHVAPCGAV